MTKRKEKKTVSWEKRLLITNIEHQEKALLAGVYSSPRERWEAKDSLEELASLAQTAGAVVWGSTVQFKEKRDPRFYIGKGKIMELAELCQKEGINLVIFDEPLNPSQVRNIEEVLGQKVIDRTQLILDIFARRARNKEGKLQVELAQLNYLLPRLAGKGLYLSQLGGGIGTRGPGETKLEFDRRKIKNRIAKVRQQIQRIAISRQQQRKRRESRLLPLVSLVGYTNAGKTTLFNLLTNSAAPTSHNLFNTLDPLIRRLRLLDGQLCLLSDTVGFIHKLPHELIVAFRATLDEVKKADLLINVIDISDPNSYEQHKDVIKVLESLSITQRPIINVLNKTDLITSALLPNRGRRIDNPIYMSALTGEGKDALLRRIVALLSERRVAVTFEIPPADGRLRSLLHREGRVLREVYRGERMLLEAEVPRAMAQKYRRYLVGS